MWTFDRVTQEFDEWVTRSVIFELNNLICGRGLDGFTANRIGLEDELWLKLLRRGGLTDEGITKVMAGERISQRDTSGPFDPFTFFSISRVDHGDGAILTPEETARFIEKTLRFQGRLSEDGAIVRDLSPDSHA